MFSLPTPLGDIIPDLSSLHLGIATGLVSLAPLTSIARRTAICGAPSWHDIFFLAPGLHKQQCTSELNNGEYPPAAAMTTGYVFRIENQGTVRFLQSIGKPGHLVCIAVESKRTSSTERFNSGASMLYLLGPLATITTLTIVTLRGDFWAVGFLSMLIAARLCNTIVIVRRLEPGWKGAPEPGVRGDLLVLVSQDRWFRIRGLVDDLKVVTAGQWLRDVSPAEDFGVDFATVLVYFAAGLAFNMSAEGSLVVLGLLLCSWVILGVCNHSSAALRMHGRVLEVDGKPKAYFRRTDLVEELVQESGREDWAERLGMISRPERREMESALL